MVKKCSWKKSSDKRFIALWKNKNRDEVFLHKRGNPEQGYVYDVVLETKSGRQEVISDSNKKAIAMRKAKSFMNKSC